MRLIDADRLKEAIHTDFSEHFTLYHDTDQTALIDMVMDDIDEMPSAFDKEKVMGDMYLIGRKHCENVSCEEECDDCNHGVIMNSLIEVVKKGGVE